MLLNLCRGLIPACLALGALLAAVPTLADTPAAPSVSASTPQLIVLQHTIPGDIVKLLHWDSTVSLPTGVTHIQTLPAQNALAVTGTSSGVSQVREIIKILDIVPRQALIQLVYAHASEADLKASGIEFDLVPLPPSGSKQKFLRYSTGPALVSFLLTLTKGGAVTQAPDITTTNNVSATVSLTTELSARKTVVSEVRVIPRINADNSVTLDLHTAFSEGAGKREVNTLRTVPSGSTFVIALPPAASSNEDYLLIFVTATAK